MQNTKLSEKLSVAPQIQIEDVAQIAQMGFGTIICNRPDNEDAGQPLFSDIAAAAKAAGMVAIHQPITPPTLTLAEAKKFGETIAASQKPVFGYCRTGTRCTTLWALSERESGQDAQTLADYCESLGYNVSGALQNIGRS